MTIYDHDIAALDGTPGLLDTIAGKTALLVNVASRCGLTPQYSKLEALQEKYADRNFTVVGFPCNQFYGQEPGTAQEIAEFCSVSYGVTFPLSEKIDVNGDDQHPLYADLKSVPDYKGRTDRDIKWNFEKFLVDTEGTVIGRYSPQTEPDDPDLVADIEKALAG